MYLFKNGCDIMYFKRTGLFVFFFLCICINFVYILAEEIAFEIWSVKVSRTGFPQL